MKKHLLLFLALALYMASFAQKRNLNCALTKVSPLGANQHCIADPNPPATSNNPVKPKTIVVAGTKAGLNETRIGTSGNMLMVQYPETRIISTYPDLNAISFTHRGGGSMGSIVNKQVSSFSFDGGATFQQLALTSDSLWANRYPSGVLFNKAGNTNPDNLFLAYGGPFHLSGVWTGYYLCSERLDKTDSNYNYHHWTKTRNDFIMDNWTSCSDGYVHAFSPCTYDTNTIYLGNSYSIYSYNYYTDVINGKLASGYDTIQWNFVRIKMPACAHSLSCPLGTLLFSWGQAWSEDGTIGYIYYFGIDSLSPYNNSVVPIVYKSTTQGSTWVKQPVFDFRTLPVIEDSIYPLHSDTTKAVPFIPGMEFQYAAHSGVVDANGNLHICTIVCGEYTNYIDSVGFTYSKEPQKLYELYTTSTGWSANYITRINSLGVLYTDAEAIPTTATGDDAMGWNHRITMSRTTDGTKLFVTYMDEFDTVAHPKLVLPDLYSYGWDINTGYHTTVKNFTHNTLYDGTITWMYAADKVLSFWGGGSTCYNIPVTTTRIGFYQTDTCAHYYLSGITFCSTDGINEINENTNLINIYPNPTTDNITINVSTTLNIPATIEITNIQGQVIKQQTTNLETTNIDVTALARGMYFVKVKTEKGIAVKKFIKE